MEYRVLRLGDHIDWNVGERSFDIQHHGPQTDFGSLRWELGNDEVDEFERCDLLVGDVIPELVPDLISGERILNSVQVGFKCRNGFAVVSDFGISVVSVVDHVSCDWLLEIHSDLVQLLVAAKHDILHIGWVEIVVVESDVNHLLPETVQAQLVDGLLDSEGLNFGVLVILNDTLERVDSSSLKPRVGPFLDFEIVTHLLVLRLVVSFLEHPDEIIKDGVFPGVFVEISMEGSFELWRSNNKMKLLEERCTLSVGNTIKDTLCLLQRRDLATDWVSSC